MTQQKNLVLEKHLASKILPNRQITLHVSWPIPPPHVIYLKVGS